MRVQLHLRLTWLIISVVPCRRSRQPARRTRRRTATLRLVEFIFQVLLCNKCSIAVTYSTMTIWFIKYLLLLISYKLKTILISVRKQIFVCVLQEKGGVFSGMFKKPPKLSEAPQLEEVNHFTPHVFTSVSVRERLSVCLHGLNLSDIVFKPSPDAALIFRYLWYLLQIILLKKERKPIMHHWTSLLCNI